MERPTRISRPYMPGYGTLPENEGTGLLPWSWAEERLVASRNYWLVSVWPSGGPHAMPVWGLWHENAFLFSSSKPSRKAKNLGENPRCVVATENAKYETDYKVDMVDPAVNSCFRVRPRWVFGLKEGDFTGSPTRWDFET